MKKQWKIKSVDEQAVQLLSEQSGLSPLLSKLLVLRGIREVNQCNHYLAPNPAHFHDPFLFQDMKTAVLRVMKAIETEERVLIHGDYDVDGIASTCLLLEVLQELGLQPNFFIPNRLSEGYGIQVENIAEFAKEYDLLITVDCGINSWEAVELANQNGLDVIITDHHEPGAVKPNAIAVINPMCKDETYPFKYLCGAGVVWKFAAALRIHAGLSDELLDQIDTDDLAEATRLMEAADTIFLLGQNRSAPVVVLMRYLLTMIGKRCVLLDPGGGLATHMARAMTPGDLLLAVSFRDYATEVVRIVDEARTADVPIIAISDTTLSPLANPANILFALPEHRQSLSRSLAAPICVAQALVLGTAARLQGTETDPPLPPVPDR